MVKRAVVAKQQAGAQAGKPGRTGGTDGYEADWIFAEGQSGEGGWIRKDCSQVKAWVQVQRLEVVGSIGDPL